jgi:hypothetical protein
MTYLKAACRAKCRRLRVWVALPRLSVISGSGSCKIDGEGPCRSRTGSVQAMNTVRIILVDDHPLIREAIGHLVASVPDFELVGEAANGKECLERVADLQPDILVLDIAMPDMNGEQVCRELRHRLPCEPSRAARTICRRKSPDQL